MGRRSGILLALLLAALWSGGCSPAYRVKQGILDEDTLWRGRIFVEGVVLVDRNVHLRIEPGTEVIFPFRDDDGDGIGDGELNVLGRITAVGTPEKPIVFRSERGRKKDWTFLHLSGNSPSRLEYCVFRDAFTGVQLHYIRADVRNCLFTGNHEGLRYSTIQGSISHNAFVENTVGIRFEGRQSEVSIEYNLFRDNETALFPVTRGSVYDRVSRNNFIGNSTLVRLGLEQSGDLSFTDNYWGTSSLEKVLDAVFDGRNDPLLGKVTMIPLRKEPVPGAGPERPLTY